MNTNAWRWFPLGIAAAIAVAFAVNGYMVYDAVRTFPGAAGADGFDLSKDYSRIVAAESRQATLGWQVDTGLDAERHPVLHLANRAGAVLADPKIEAQAERPVGPKDMAVLTFRAAGDGAYQAATSLAPGQWDLMVTVRADGQVLTTTRRILVR